MVQFYYILYFKFEYFSVDFYPVVTHSNAHFNSSFIFLFWMTKNCIYNIYEKKKRKSLDTEFTLYIYRLKNKASAG